MYFIKNEFMKLIKSRGFITVLLACIIIDGMTFLASVINVGEAYKEHLSEDYADITNLAIDNYNSKSDAGLMYDIYYRYDGRELAESYYLGDNIYTEWSMSEIIMIIFAVIVAMEMIECERKPKVESIVISSGQALRRVYIPKIVLQVVIPFMLAITLFFIETIFLVLAGGNPMDNLYNMREYFATWFSGSIFSYRLLGMLGVAAVSSIISLLAYLVIGLSKKTEVGALSALLFAGALTLLRDSIPVKLSYCNLFELDLHGFMAKTYSVFFIGEKQYMNSITVLWIIAVLIIILLMILNIHSASKRVS